MPKGVLMKRLMGMRLGDKENRFYPICPEKKELVARRKEQERLKQIEISKQMEINQTADAISEMKTMNIPEDTIKKAQETLETQARDKVRDIQGGIAYETMD